MGKETPTWKELFKKIIEKINNFIGYVFYIAFIASWVILLIYLLPQIEKYVHFTFTITALIEFIIKLVIAAFLSWIVVMIIYLKFLFLTWNENLLISMPILIAPVIIIFSCVFRLVHITF